MAYLQEAVPGLLRASRGNHCPDGGQVRVPYPADSLLIRLFPHSIDVTFDVGLSRYEVVSDTSFSFYVDYNQIKTNPGYIEGNREVVVLKVYKNKIVVKLKTE